VLVEVGAVWRRLRDQEGDAYLLALARVGFGLLLLNEAWLARQQLVEAGYFGGYFHQPFLPESLVPSEGVYQALVGAQFVVAVLVVAGRAARPALLAAAALLLFTMLCDRLWFHHYRHTMAAFCTLLAFAPCDRHLVVGARAPPARAPAPPARAPAPLWALNALKAQVSVMYLASAGSKLFDPEWRGGQMMLQMVRPFVRTARDQGLPAVLADAMQTPLGASVMAKGAITTELALAALLWWPRTRRAALWVAVCFHLAISQMTPVRLFTMEMLLVLMLFSTPDAGARVLRFDPQRHRSMNVVEGLDWLRRFELAPAAGARLVVVARDGEEKRGLAATAEIAGALPLTFLAWPLFALLAAIARRRRTSADR
jgi:hypothetical protein